MVVWERMRITWTSHSRDQLGGISFNFVKTFFNTFISRHPGYQFTVAQKYDSLYDIGITWEQYDQIKLELERGIRGSELPDINVTEYLKHGDRRKKSFSSLSEFRAYQDDFVRRRNREIVKTKLEEARRHFQKARSYFDGPGTKYILSFDLEAYEYDHDKVLEIGYVVACVGSGPPKLTEKRHLIIQENLRYKNRDYVPDNRNGFKFGESQTVSLQQAIETFCQAVMNCTFLLAHSAHRDKDYLRNIGVDISKSRKEIMDTQQVELHLEASRPGQRPPNDRLYLRGLTRLLENYEVAFDPEALHNAGSDAYYTMKVFLRQMGCSKTVVNGLA